MMGFANPSHSFNAAAVPPSCARAVTARPLSPAVLSRSSHSRRFGTRRNRGPATPAPAGAVGAQEGPAGLSGHVPAGCLPEARRGAVGTVPGAAMAAEARSEGTAGIDRGGERSGNGRARSGRGLAGLAGTGYK